MARADGKAILRTVPSCSHQPGGSMTTLLCTTMQSNVSKQNFETLMIRVRQLDILQQASKDWTDYIFNAVENLIEFRVMPSQRKNKLWSIGGSFEEFSAKKQQTISSSSFYNLEVVSSFKKFRFSPWKRPNLAIFEFGNSISWSVLQRKLLYFLILTSCEVQNALAYSI